MSIRDYRKKRDFRKTKEPKSTKTSPKKGIFVIQKHHARSLHYDFRLSFGRVLLSWAVPKGLSKKRGEKRLAVHTEDHPISYADFEGEIPKGEYGAGLVEIFDKGKYINLRKDSTGKELSLRKCEKEGLIEVELIGSRFKGAYALVHFKEKNWLILRMKEKRHEAV